MSRACVQGKNVCSRRMPRALAAILAWLALAGCFPSVSLGLDEAAETGPAAEDTAAGATSSSTGPIQETDPDAPMETTFGSGFGSAGASGDSGASAGGSPTTSSTGDRAGVCEAEAESRCQACAQEQCCDELLLCAGQPSCECFLSCFLGDTPAQDCQSACTPTSGVAAVIVCVQMACGGDCNLAGGTGAESST